ncbi:MAG: miniconductance mechanosensitive channel [Verrucomicrobiales bacterium]|jgi:miniconductance mechanosensitive channel
MPGFFRLSPINQRTFINMKPKPRSLSVYAGTAFVVMIAVFYVLSKPKDEWNVIIMSGDDGLTFRSLGDQLKWSLSELHGNPINMREHNKSGGSAKNLDELLITEEETHRIGFVSKAVLNQRLDADPSIAEQVRVIATLYQDQLQVVVRTNINSLEDLNGKNVFMGGRGSTTETIASNILSSLEINFTKETVRAPTQNTDAAFYMAGMLAPDVITLLEDGSHKLLNLADVIEQISEAFDFTQNTILPFTYNSQTEKIQTLQDDVYLLANASLPDDLAYLIVKALFDDVTKLQKAQRIRLENVLQTNGLPSGIELHPGVEEFQDDEAETLYIAAAGINDKYWNSAVKIGKLLSQRGIRSRVVATDGSLENLDLLETNTQPTLAIVQYDVALAAHTGDAEFIYDLSVNADEEPAGKMDGSLPGPVSGMRRIATLHEEKLHMMYRTDPDRSWGPAELLQETNWQELVVCIGPTHSGTRLVADTVLRLSEYEPLTTTELPVRLMVERIFDGSIDVGFYMGNVPNPGIKTLLGSGTARLLDVDSRVIARLSGQVFKQRFIGDPRYRSSEAEFVTVPRRALPSDNVYGPADKTWEQGVSVETVGTRAVLVTTTDLPFDVYEITKAVFEGASILGLSTNEMAADLAIPLHPDALDHYRQMEYPGYTKPETLVNSLGDRWWAVFHTIETVLTRSGVRAATAGTVSGVLATLIAVLLGVLINYSTKNFILAGLTKAWNHAETKWDAIFIEKKVLNLLSYLVSAVVIYALVAIAMARNDGSPLLEQVITSAVLIYMLFLGVMVFNCLINGALVAYRTYPISREIPLKGVIQLCKIVVYGVAAILGVAIIFDRSPIYLLSGLSALTGIGMLIFKDSILGFVSGLQLSGNRMVARGDWIAMPKRGLDGEVLEVSLAMVKVQNFDKSIVTVPTQALTSDAFQNWRGMQQSGGRRLKRSIHIDISTIKNCDEPLLDRLMKIRRLQDYLTIKRSEIAEHNKERGIDSLNKVDGRRLTNIGLFRAYLVSYLKDHSKIQQDTTLLVRQLEPVESGLPIEICAFIKETAWKDFEAVQADIFDHVLAIVPQFDLKVFQGPAGGDFRLFGQQTAGLPTPATNG